MRSILYSMCARIVKLGCTAFPPSSSPHTTSRGCLPPHARALTHAPCHPRRFPGSAAEASPRSENVGGGSVSSPSVRLPPSKGQGAGPFPHRDLCPPPPSQSHTFFFCAMPRRAIGGQRGCSCRGARAAQALGESGAPPGDNRTIKRPPGKSKHYPKQTTNKHDSGNYWHPPKDPG